MARPHAATSPDPPRPTRPINWTAATLATLHTACTASAGGGKTRVGRPRLAVEMMHIALPIEHLDLVARCPEGGAAWPSPAGISALRQLAVGAAAAVVTYVIGGAVGMSALLG